MSFKPKHHFLVHYARVMRLMGPLWHIAGMNFERKHRGLKVTSRVSLSRVNICHTLALKEQLALNYFFLQPPDYSEFSVGPSTIVQIDIFKSLHMKFLHGRIPIVQWAAFDGQILKPGMILMHGSTNEFKFHLVQYLVLSPSDKLLAITKELVCWLDEHLQSYEIYESKSPLLCLSWAKIRQCKISRKKRLGDSTEYVLKRWW